MESRAACVLLLGCFISLLAFASACDVTVNGGGRRGVVSGGTTDFAAVCIYPTNGLDHDRLEWLLNGEVYSSSTGDSALLGVENFTLSVAGEYRCRAVLSNGTTCPSVYGGTLTVYDSSLIMAPPNQYVLEDGDILMQCSSPQANSVHWEPTNTAIINAQVEDEINGDYDYSCALFFAEASITIATQAVVIVPPRLAQQRSPGTQFLTGGEGVILFAEFVSRTRQHTTVSWVLLESNSPEPNYSVETTWTDEARGELTTSLTIDRLSRSDTGTYRVSVTNNNEIVPEDQRTASLDLYLKVTVPPAKPMSLRFTPHNDTHYIIRWQFNFFHDDERATSLELNVMRPFVTMHQVPSPTAQEFFLPVLPGNEHEIRLTAENVDGSVMSDPLSFTVPASDPLVNSVKVDRLNETALLVTLDLIHTGGGDITRIRVSWTNGLALYTDQPMLQTNGQWTGMIVRNSLSDLQLSSGVEFTVTITNQEEMFITHSVRQSFLLPGRPAAPALSFTSGTSFTVEVQLSSTGSQPLIAVVLELFDRNQQISTFNKTGSFSNGETVMVTATGLIPDYQYTVTAYAVNNGGRGPSSEPATVNTYGTSLPISDEAIIGISVVGSVLVTIIVIILVLWCVYVTRKCRNKGKKYCPKDYKDPPVMRDNDEIDSKASTNCYSNGYSRGDGSYSPRSPTMNSRASSCIPQTGTGTSEYSYEESEVDIVLPVLLHKKQSSDIFYEGSNGHYPRPLNLHPQHILSTSGSVFSPDDMLSPPATALSFATDV